MADLPRVKKRTAKDVAIKINSEWSENREDNRIFPSATFLVGLLRSMIK